MLDCADPGGCPRRGRAAPAGGGDAPAPATGLAPVHPPRYRSMWRRASLRLKSPAITSRAPLGLSQVAANCWISARVSARIELSLALRPWGWAPDRGRAEN